MVERGLRPISAKHMQLMLGDTADGHKAIEFFRAQMGRSDDPTRWRGRRKRWQLGAIGVAAAVELPENTPGTPNSAAKATKHSSATISGLPDWTAQLRPSGWCHLRCATRRIGQGGSRSRGLHPSTLGDGFHQHLPGSTMTIQAPKWYREKIRDLVRARYQSRGSYLDAPFRAATGGAASSSSR